MPNRIVRNRKRAVGGLKLEMICMRIVLVPTLAIGSLLFAMRPAIGQINISADQFVPQPAELANSLPESAPVQAPLSVNERAGQLMLNALLQAVWGDGRRCHVKQRIVLFDRELVGFGQYAHAGGGSGKLKMSLRFAAGDQLNSFQQVSDGKLLQTTSIMGDKIDRRRVDIGKVHEHMPISEVYYEDPVITMYLAIGGQGEILRKLCQQYRWFDIQTDRLGEDDVWLLKGELVTEPPKTRALAQIDSKLYEPNVSGLLPQYVRVALGRAHPNQLWLFRVEQWKAKPMTIVGDPHPLSAVIEFIQPEIDRQLPPAMFEDAGFASSTDPIEDETEKYTPPHQATATIAPQTTQR